MTVKDLLKNHDKTDLWALLRSLRNDVKTVVRVDYKWY